MVSQRALRQKLDTPRKLERNEDGDIEYPRSADGSAGDVYTYDEARDGELPPPESELKKNDGLNGLSAAAALAMGAAIAHRRDAEGAERMQAELHNGAHMQALNNGAKIAPTPDSGAPIAVTPVYAMPRNDAEAQRLTNEANRQAQDLRDEGVREQNARMQLQAETGNEPSHIGRQHAVAAAAPVVASAGVAHTALHRAAPAADTAHLPADVLQDMEFTATPLWDQELRSGYPVESPETGDIGGDASFPLPPGQYHAIDGTEYGSPISQDFIVDAAHHAHVQAHGAAMIAQTQRDKALLLAEKRRSMGLPTAKQDEIAGWAEQRRLSADGAERRAFEAEVGARWRLLEDEGDEYRAEQAAAARRAHLEEERAVDAQQMAQSEALQFTAMQRAAAAAQPETPRPQPAPERQISMPETQQKPVDDSRAGRTVQFAAQVLQPQQPMQQPVQQPVQQQQAQASRAPRMPMPLDAPSPAPGGDMPRVAPRPAARPQAAPKAEPQVDTARAARSGKAANMNAARDAAAQAAAIAPKPKAAPEEAPAPRQQRSMPAPEADVVVPVAAAAAASSVESMPEDITPTVVENGLVEPDGPTAEYAARMEAAEEAAPVAVVAETASPESEPVAMEAGTDAAESAPPVQVSLPPSVSVEKTEFGSSYVFTTPPAAREIGFEASVHLGTDDGSGAGLQAISAKAWSLTQEIEGAIKENDEKLIDQNPTVASVHGEAAKPGDLPDSTRLAPPDAAIVMDSVPDDAMTASQEFDRVDAEHYALMRDRIAREQVSVDNPLMRGDDEEGEALYEATYKPIADSASPAPVAVAMTQAQIEEEEERQKALALREAMEEKVAQPDPEEPEPPAPK